MPNPNSFPPGLPLVAYAEQLCKGARVLIVGDSALPLAEAVMARGARLVHVVERDPIRRAELAARSALRAITFGGPDEDLREGTFDLLLVENLAGEPDPHSSVRSLSRMVSPRGTVLIAAPNPDAGEPLVPPSRYQGALDYYALYDAVTAALPHVRMLGQVPFVGYALIDFAAEGEPAPVFDTSLVPARGEEPEYFVAFGSHHPKPLDEYVVVQLSSAAVALARKEAAKTNGNPPAPEATVQKPAPVQVRPTDQGDLTSELKKQLTKQEAWITELEARATVADERADTAESELDELRERLGNLALLHTGELTSLRGERDAAREEVERLRRRANDLSDLLEIKQAELSSAASETESSNEVAKLEAQLLEQGQKLRGLEVALREAERTGRSLVRKLSSPPTSKLVSVRADTAEPTPSTTEVAERLVEAEAELVSLRWSLSMLMHQRAGGALPPGVPS